ncbi:MAG: hypothetical protein AB2598_20630 [Candidatus Thiodiazotropha sp.]
MEVSKVYVPDHFKWKKYYEDLLSQKIGDAKNGNNWKSPDEYLVSKESSSEPKETAADPLRVKLVSTVKQANDQVVSELRREADGDSIKPAALQKTNRSMKRQTKKGRKKGSGKKKQKTQRSRIKKNKNKRKTKKVKRRIKDIFTL